MTDRFAQIPAEPIAAHVGAPLLQRSGGFARLTLNRPTEHTRLDPADVDALTSLFGSLAADSDMRVLVITGTGEKTFSSGYTLHALINELDARFENMLDTLEALPFITIAMLNGSVYGGATDMSLCCDLRIGMPGLKFRMPAARIGLHYYPGGLRRYVTRLGLATASRLMLTATTIDSDEMMRVGFLTEMVDRKDLVAHVDAWLEHLGQNDPLVVARMKGQMRELAQAGIPPELLARIGDDYRASVKSDSLRERLGAMLGKKKS